MTDKQKLEKIKVLADAMYNAAFNITTDASHLKKAMYDYHQFLIYEYYKEEPVSIWHNMEELPIKGEVIVVQTKDTFYGLSVQKGGSTYKNRNKDRYIKWAYASDLLNLSNVQKTVKNGKEPVSNDLKVALEDYAYQVAYDLSHDWLKENATWDEVETAVKLGAQWQKEQMEKNRIENCDNITEEQYNLESDFVSNHIEKNNRIPTILDAIEYGMERQKQWLIDKACEWIQGFMECSNLFEYEVSESEQKEVINDFKQIMEE